VSNIDVTLGMVSDVLGLTEEEYGQMREIILAREDNIADHVRLAARQFNCPAEIVAEVLAQSGLGTPIPNEERKVIRKNFVSLMNRTQQGWREQ
jgi:hypothetical protein